MNQTQLAHNNHWQSDLQRVSETGVSQHLISEFAFWACKHLGTLLAPVGLLKRGRRWIACSKLPICQPLSRKMLQKHIGLGQKYFTDANGLEQHASQVLLWARFLTHSGSTKIFMLCLLLLILWCTAFSVTVNHAGNSTAVLSSEKSFLQICFPTSKAVPLHKIFCASCCGPVFSLCKLLFTGDCSASLLKLYRFVITERCYCCEYDTVQSPQCTSLVKSSCALLKRLIKYFNLNLMCTWPAGLCCKIFSIPKKCKGCGRAQQESQGKLTVLRQCLSMVAQSGYLIHVIWSKSQNAYVRECYTTNKLMTNCNASWCIWLFLS